MMTRHISLAEWDNKVAPLLSAIEIRAGKVERDAEQIDVWVGKLTVAPDFETNAVQKLETATSAVERTLNKLRMALESYSEKERVS